MVMIDKKVGKIINGAKAHTVDGSAGGGIGVVSNGLVVLYGDEDIKAIENDDAHPGAENPQAPGPDDEVVGETAPDAQAPTIEPTNCGGISGDSPPSLVLGPGFTLGMMTDGRDYQKNQPVAGKHTLRPQHNYTKAQIICHLKTLVNTCLVPIANKWGRDKFVVNSGFRTNGDLSSQHRRGMAADLQFHGKSQTEVLAIAEWCRVNLNYDQLIFEKKTGFWIHISYDPYKTTQRRDVMSCNVNRGGYIDGLVRL